MVFKDPIARPKGKEQRNPWSFECPPYDQRSSCYVDAGSHYGIGKKTPVGHMDNPKSKVATLPFSKKAPKVDEAPRKMKKLEIIK